MKRITCARCTHPVTAWQARCPECGTSRKETQAAIRSLGSPAFAEELSRVRLGSALLLGVLLVVPAAWAAIVVDALWLQTRFLHVAAWSAASAAPVGIGALILLTVRRRGPAAWLTSSGLVLAGLVLLADGPLVAARFGTAAVLAALCIPALLAATLGLLQQSARAVGLAPLRPRSVAALALLSLLPAVALVLDWPTDRAAGGVLVWCIGLATLGAAHHLLRLALRARRAIPAAP